MAAAQFVLVPGYSAMILRRSFADLMQADGLIPRSKEWWAEKASWSAQEKRWTFPSGATITFGYLDRDDDVYQYQGAAFHFCAVDELTQHTEFRYRYLFSRQRRPSEGPASSIPLRMRAGSNPGGHGHEWVKKRFIPDEYLADKTGARNRRCWWKEGRLFVPSRRIDNPHLDQDTYAASLAELPPVTRAQLDEGDWQAHEGGHFQAKWFGRYRDNVDHWYVESTGEVARKVTCQIIIAVDPAGGISDSADPTAMVVGALTPGGTLLLLDVVRDRIAVEHIVPRLLELCLRWKPFYVCIEDGFLQSHYIRLARATPGIPTVHDMQTEGRSKLVRATPAIIRAEHGGIALPQEAHWIEDYLSELCSFTGDDKLDAHDDQVDATAWLCQAIDRYRIGRGNSKPLIFPRR